MVPATAVPPGPVTLKLATVSVAGFIAVLKVALMSVFKATFVAPLAGIVDTTAGPVTTSSPHPAMKMAIRAMSKQLIPTGPFRICNLSCNCGDKISKPYRLVGISQAAETSWRSQISNRNFRVRAKLLKSGTKLKTRSLHVKSLNAIKAERNHLGKTASFFPIWLGIIVCNVDRRK
jgi:hypothetical protein